VIRMFRRRPAEPVELPLPDGKTRDYTNRGWGHDYVIHHVIDGGRELRCSGWGPGFGPRIVRGDYLILPGKDPGATTRYQVAEIEYHMDPADMWAATLRFAPRDALAKEAT
jgi:hypothetical protein